MSLDMARQHHPMFGVHSRGTRVDRPIFSLQPIQAPRFQVDTNSLSTKTTHSFSFQLLETQSSLV